MSEPGLFCLRFSGKIGRNLTLWLGDGYKVTDMAHPEYMVPWLFEQYKDLDDFDVFCNKLMDGYHWKHLYRTSLSCPSTVRWTSTEKGPLRLLALRQPALKTEKFEGWLYILDKTYHTITVAYKLGWATRLALEIWLDEELLPKDWSSIFIDTPYHNEELEQAILLRYAFDFALTLYQKEKEKGG